MNGVIEKGAGKIDGDALERINRYTRRPYKAEEVYTFSVVLCDNEVDRDYECFTRDALGKLAVLFEGKTGLLDHEHTSRGQSARIYAARVKDFPEKRTSRGEPYAQLTAEAYVPRNAETAAFIESIESGIRKEVSVGCAVAKRTCSVCGAEHCAHQRGRLYDGERCVRILDEPTDAYEFSFVAPTTSGLQTLKQDSEKRAGMTAWDMTVALCVPNLDHLLFGTQTHGDQAEMLKADKVVAGERSPCTFCRYAPPSAGDGKPCTYCPAEGV